MSLRSILNKCFVLASWLIYVQYLLYLFTVQSLFSGCMSINMGQSLLSSLIFIFVCKHTNSNVSYTVNIIKYDLRMNPQDQQRARIEVMPTQTQTCWPLFTSTSVHGDCLCFSWLNNRFEWHRESWSRIRPNLWGLSPKALLCVFVNRNMVPWDCLSACQPAVSYMLSDSLLHLK